MNAIGVSSEFGVLQKKKRCMTTLNSLQTEPNSVNSYLQLFHVAQQNFLLWQREQKKQRLKGRRYRSKQHDFS